MVAQRLNEGLNRFSLDVESKHLVFSGHLSPSQNSSAYTLWADSFPKKVFAFAESEDMTQYNNMSISEIADLMVELA